MSERELVERLERLEASIFGAQAVPQTITAHGFKVMDSSGRIRLRMGMEEGRPGIGLFDAQGKGRMQVALTPEGAPSIALFDAQGGPRAGITVDPFGAAGIGVYDAQGKTRAAIGINQNGEVSIQVCDSQEKPRVEMSVDSSGSPTINVTDAEGSIGVRMSVNSSGGPRISLSDSQGFGMHLGNASMVRADTGATEQTSAASIVMIGNDKEHHVIWQAP